MVSVETGLQLEKHSCIFWMHRFWECVGMAAATQFHHLSIIYAVMIFEKISEIFKIFFEFSFKMNKWK